MYRKLMFSIIAPLLFLLTGCGVSTKHIPAVTEFDADRYLGKWYEIARIPHFFERGLTDCYAIYENREDGGIKVTNWGYCSQRKAWKVAQGRAYFSDNRSVGALRVSFFRPFYGTYKIIALDRKNYRWSMITSGTYNYLWILSRSPVMSAEQRKELLKAAQELGFNTSEMLIVDQSRNINALFQEAQKQ
ncbi:MAG: lipocalin [Lentisphaerae bacterium]|nr:lipocalin [Lentisphaerota bacterium]MCP4102266.1 lipocalin [Lentisphaerota bacterium]